MRKGTKDETGSIYGRLTVIGLGKPITATKGSSKRVTWECRCTCDKIVTVRGDQLRNGHTTSCGCLQRDNASKANKGNTYGRTHGQASINGKRSKEYKTWSSMKERCYGPYTASYHNYGGRGITVCDRWRNSFENFFEDLGKAPTKKHSIDRIDPDGNYEPENVRWATDAQQANNRRNTKIITALGQTKPIGEWARFLGTSRVTIFDRIKRGWSEEDAVTKPVTRKRGTELLTADGVTHTISEWSKKLGTRAYIIRERIKRGWTERDAVTKPVKKIRSWSRA